MNRARLLLSMALIAALVPVAGHPQETSRVAPSAAQGVAITSHLTGTVASGGQVNLTLVGVASHTQSGLSVLFTTKYLVAVNPGDLGPVTVTLNPQQRSVGTLSSKKFPAEHRQKFFLQIHSEKLGTLVSAAPIVLSARIESSPPTATYKSAGGNVAFYKEGDPGKKPVLTVQEVTSEVKPAASQAVDIKSRVTATVAGKPVNLQLAGTASHLLSGTTVLFTTKRLVAVNPGRVGPLTITLNPRRTSAGTLSSEKFPADHRQSFFLQIQSKRLGTLVSDDPLVLTAHIDSSPPTATYKSEGKPVAFYKQGDRGKKPVLTIETVESDVTPPKQGYPAKK
jgi:hypothetical protein